MFRVLWVVPLSGFAVAATSGCKSRCRADVTINEDAAQSATLLWRESVDEGTVSVSFFGEEDTEERQGSVSSDGRRHTATLWGLPPLSEITYSFTTSEGTCTDSFTTVGLPSGLPDFAVSIYDESAAADWQYIAGVAMGEAGTLFILDRSGQWRYHQSHDRALNVSAVTFDGGNLIHNSFDQNRSNDIGQVHLVDVLTGTSEDVRTEGAHHTFAYLPDGTIAFPSVDVRTWVDPSDGEEYTVVGDRILEVAPDGTVREVWNMWDIEEPTVHDSWDSGFYGDLGSDWTHVNALNYSAERDSYLISVGHLDAIYEISRDGDVLLSLTPESVVSGEPYNFQHDPNWSPAGTLLLLSYPEDQPAVALEYEVAADGTLTEVWSHARERVATTLLGQVRRLPNGNTFINYGGIGEMQEVTPDGDVVWQINAGLGAWFGNVELLDSLPALP